MRVLITTNAAVGHFLPMAPTAAALVALGHDVRVGCPASFAPFVRRAGFEPLSCHEVEVSVTVPALPAAGDVDGRLMWAATLSWPADCRSWVDSLLAQARWWQPDVVVVEPVEHAGRVVAAVLRRPLVVHGWGFTLPAQVEELAAGGILDVYERLSAVPPTPALVADLGSADVQAPDTGPVQRHRYRTFAMPDSPLPPPRTANRRVLVTLGTYPNPSAATLIRTAVGAALDTGAEAVAVLGNEDRDGSVAFPPGAIVLPWVNMSAAVADCDLVVHHAGAGTSWTTLSGGKPAVVLPQAGDQYRNAQSLAAAGAALICPSEESRDISAAIAHASGRPCLTEQAARIARTNQTLPDITELAGDIAALAV